jgi:plasmid stability protein
MDTHSTSAHIDAVAADAAASSRIDGGRLGVYAALGATVGTVPLPWVPDALARRVRGALVHDVAVRHGLSLSHEAREILASPAGLDESKGIFVRTARQFGVRLALKALTRVGPVGVVWPLGHAVRTYALGHLFDRYLAQGRTGHAVRIEENEARRVRHAIDGALKRALSVSTAPATELAAVDDQRDSTTALVDSVLVGAAGVPARLLARLDAAFDDLFAHADV